MEYGLDTNYGSLSSLETTLATNHSVILSGLIASQTYHFRIKSDDEFDNSGTSNDLTFTTADTTDEIPPVLSNINVVNITDTSATVQWQTNEASDSRVSFGLNTGYGNEQFNENLVINHSIDLYGLRADTIYHVQVESRDNSSNVTLSEDFTFQTAREADIIPPVISNIIESDITESSITISWQTDEKSGSYIEYGPDTTFGNEISEATLVTQHSLVLTNLSNNTTYFYRISSRDSSNNVSSSLTFKVTTDFGFGPVPDGAIAIYETNPYYFSYKGNPVLLLGGSDEDNIFNFPDMMMQNLATLEQIGGNYIRCTMSSRNDGNVWPYLQNGEGKYDLDQFNPEYWNRLENCLREADARDIIVQIELWATFDYYREYWLVNPFNPANNINYTTENTQLVPEWPYHPANTTQPFVFSIPEQNNDTILLDYQRKFVSKILSISSKYGNVLYCIDNETEAPLEWASYWARFIQEKAARAQEEVLITEMWDAHDLKDVMHQGTYTHPELFAYFDISQNNWQVEQTHYDNILWAKEELNNYGGPRPLTNVKVYQRLESGEEIPAINLDRWWQNIFAGCASTRFHRATGGIGLNDTSQQAINAASVYTKTFNLFNCETHPELLSDRAENEAYCFANPGEVYALYFENGGNVSLAIDNPQGDMQVNWFDPITAEFVTAQKIVNESQATLSSPNTSQTWLALVERPQFTIANVGTNDVGMTQATIQWQTSELSDSRRRIWPKFQFWIFNSS